MIFQNIISKIKESGKIAILSHIMPDGDSIGSSLALYNALKKYGKDVRFILDDEIPTIYGFLEGSDRVREPGQFEHFDTVLVLDCGDVERLGKSSLYLNGNYVINIDHHISNKEFGSLNLVDTGSAASGEIIYDLIKSLDIGMDRGICECLYTAIVTDTGQFQYSNTTSRTHQIVGDLIDSGVNVSRMFERIYQNNSKEKIVLMKTALSTLEFFHNDATSCISLSLEQMKEANALDEDTEGIINLARDIGCVEVAMFLKEIEPGLIKVGLRSKKKANVAAVALRFGGGGHVHAAGCTVHGTIAEVKEKMLDAVAEELR
ncbi:MAG TPA: bifunctional oligoribonuclease/PAP phosphatase NrnA [Bacillota bacterium]|nr:bifunctional oligoribonuclease/PAP phosphatase NrnA [Bacillota bacterium]